MKNEIFGKIGVVIGFTIFLIALGYTYYTVKSANYGTGAVYVQFVQTQNDADCILVYQKGAAILIDAGEEEDTETILKTLSENNIEELDYFILTHGDKDHIGSAYAVLDNVKVGRVVAPYYYGNDTFDTLLDNIKERDINILYPTHNTRVRAGELNIVIYPSLESNYTDENNYSLATLISHYDVNMLFTADAMRKRTLELEMVHWPQISLYKVPYHGRANSQSDDFLDMLSPEFAVVTSDTCDEAIIESAKKNDCEIMYSVTDSIVFVSNGKTINKE